MANKQTSKAAWFWIKNTSGKPDAILTLTLLSFLLVTGAYLASVLGSLTIGALAMTFNSFDAAYATTITVPLLATYAGRRWTDANKKTTTADNNDGYGE